MVVFLARPGYEVSAWRPHFPKETDSPGGQTAENATRFLEAFALIETAACVPPFFHSDAPIGPRSKIARRAMPRLCFAFCWPLRVDEAARLTGYSVTTVRSVYISLRQLLLDPRYRKWHDFEKQAVLRKNWFLHLISWNQLWMSYADCYESQQCQRDFSYGKRKERECTKCAILRVPVVLLLSKDYRYYWLDIVDRTRDFYLNTLGIRREEGYLCEIFRRRVYHQQIVISALYHSRAEHNGKPGPTVNHLKRGPLTVLNLWETLLKHIAERGGLTRGSPQQYGPMGELCLRGGPPCKRMLRARCRCNWWHANPSPTHV